MSARSILFILAALGVIGGLAYLVILVAKDPPKTEAPARSRSSAKVNRIAERPALGAPRDPSRKLPPHLQAAKDSPPKPFQARSEPAKNHELYRGVEGDEMSHRVNNFHIKYRKRKWREVLAEAPALIEELPENVQIRRILVRAACNLGEVKLGHEYMKPLPESDQIYLREHCRIYGARAN